MDPIKEYKDQVLKNIDSLGQDNDLLELSHTWSKESNRHGYTYNFNWMGRPIIQYPQDMIAMQEIIWEVKPDLIIETGIAHGGSLIYYASLLELLATSGECDGKVLGIDIDIRKHNRVEIETHPMFKRIDMIQGSSTDHGVIKQVENIATGHQQVLVVLDSNHTHAHVLAELQAYAPLVSINSYCVVFDTLIEDMPGDIYPDRNWGPGNNPKTAVWEYLENQSNFQIDKNIHNKLLITVAPDGYLKRIK